MKKYLCYILLGLVFLNVTLLLFLVSKFPSSNNTKTTVEDKIDTDIKHWYGRESSKYTIFSGGTKDIRIITVLDKEKNLLLAPDESCEMTIPEEYKKENYFYNPSVGIKIQGPYKSIYSKEGSDNTFRQSVLSGGCAFIEGEISVFTGENNQARCEIKIEYKDLGC